MTGEEIFRVTMAYLEEGELGWKNCLNVCTEGAASMTGRVKVYLNKGKQETPNVLVTHCFLQQEVLVAKTLLEELSSVLDRARKIVNLIKAWPLKCHLFSLLCEDKEAEHHSTLAFLWESSVTLPPPTTPHPCPFPLTARVVSFVAPA